MSTKPINILHLEDEVMDTYLVKKILERSELNFKLTVAADKATFEDAIENNEFDIIIADHSLPQFSSMDALAILLERNIHIPFVLVTGTVSEEFSVKAMKEGAWDYILKDRLQRLPSAITGAIERYNAERERQKYLDAVIRNEALMKEAEQLAHFGSWQSDFVTGISTWSDQKYRMLGFTPGSVTPSFELFMSRVHPDDLKHVTHIHDHALEHLNELKYECRLLGPANTARHIYAELFIKRNKERKILALNGFIQDITESKEALLRLQESEHKYRYLFAHSPQPAWVIDAENYKFLDVNKAAIKLYGFSFEEFMLMTAVDIRPDSEKELFKAAVKNVTMDSLPNRGIWQHIKKDGSTINVEVLSSAVAFEGRPAQLTLVTAVT